MEETTKNEGKVAKQHWSNYLKGLEKTKGVFLCIQGLGYQEARLANICSRVAGAHCDEVDENPEASRQQAVAHQYRV